MNTTLSPSATHPPDTEDRQVLEIPAPSELRALALTDRLSLKIGIWLFQRAQRPRYRPTRSRSNDDHTFAPYRHLSQREAVILVGYDLHRQLR